MVTFMIFMRLTKLVVNTKLFIQAGQQKVIEKSLKGRNHVAR